MALDASRRGFLIGLSLVLAKAAFPSTAAAPRIFVVNGPVQWGGTIPSLKSALQELFRQVAEFKPQPDEYAWVLSALEEELEPGRPIGVRINFETTLEHMVSGNFKITERPRRYAEVFIEGMS